MLTQRGSGSEKNSEVDDEDDDEGDKIKMTTISIH